MRTTIGCFWLLLACIAFAAPSFANLDSLNTFRVITKALESQSGEIQVTVRNAADGSPLQNAMVLIGAREGSPFANNKLMTDANGQAHFQSQVIVNMNAITLTAAHPGFHNMTVHQAVGREFELFLQPTVSAQDFQMLSGRFQNWPTGLPRSQIEMGLFMPAMRTESMLNFDLNLIVSSLQDEMTVMGNTVKVPGNFVLPAQDKTYGFFTIHLEKPDFHMPLPLDAQSYMAGVVGNAPLSQVVSKVQNKDYLGAVNLVQFSRLNWTNWMTVTGDQNFNLGMSRNLSANSLTSHHLSMPTNLDLVSFSLIDPTGEGKALAAMDIKAISRSAMLSPVFNPSWATQIQSSRSDVNLASLAQDPANSQGYVFSAVLDQAQFGARPMNALQFSAALSPVTVQNGHKVSTTSRYLPLITQNSVSADQKHFEFQMNTTSDFEPDYLILNLFVQTEDPTTKMEFRRLVWANVMPANVRTVDLPQTALAQVSFNAATDRYFWEVTAVRRDLAKTDGMWDSLITIQNLKYLSHARKAL